MAYLIENWPAAAGVLAFVVALIPVIRIHTGHLSHRSSHTKAQIDALQKVSDLDLSAMTPEQALVLDATVSFAYNEEISTRTYKVLRQADEPGIAVKRFRFVRPFVELCDSGDGLRFKRKRLLFRKQDNLIPTWRVVAVYSLLYFVFSLAGLFLVLLGIAAAAKASWVWSMSLTPIGIVLFGIGVISFSVGQGFETHIEAFRKATSNIFKAKPA